MLSSMTVWRASVNQIVIGLSFLSSVTGYPHLYECPHNSHCIANVFPICLLLSIYRRHQPSSHHHLLPGLMWFSPHPPTVCSPRSSQIDHFALSDQVTPCLKPSSVSFT